MPPPGDMRPARFTVELHDPIWDALYAPLRRAIGIAADRLNRLQFLTIRQYLSLVFVRARPSSAGAGAYGSDPSISPCRARRCCWCWRWRRCSPASCARSKRGFCGGAGRRAPALSRSRAAPAQGSGAGGQARPGCSASRLISIFAATWVAAVAGADLRAPACCSRWSADLIAIIALLGSARFFLALAGMDVGTSFGGIGSSREVMIASLAEPAMLMIVFTLALIAGSTQLSTVAAFMLSPQVGLRVSLGLALIGLDHGRDRRERAHSRSTIPRRISNSPWCMRRWCWNIPAAIWR